MKGRPPSLLLAALLAVGLVGCSGSPPAASTATLPSAPASAAGSGAPASAGQGSPAESIDPGDADLYGSITYTDHSRRESAPGELRQESDSNFTATITVRLIEDPAGPEGSLFRFIDAGSTYAAASAWHTERALSCGLGTTDFASDPDLAGTFVPDEQRIPLAPGASISAQIDRTLGVYTIFVDILYDYSYEQNACAGTVGGPVVGDDQVAGGALICGEGFLVFGLMGALIEDPDGPDTVDMTCSVGDAVNGTEVTGTLTLVD